MARPIAAVICLLASTAWSQSAAVSATGMQHAADMIAFSSDRQNSPSDVYLTDGRGMVLLNVTNHHRSKEFVGPRWQLSESRMSTFVNVFNPFYDTVFEEQKFGLGFSVEKTSDIHRRNQPEIDRDKHTIRSNLGISHIEEAGKFQIYTHAFGKDERKRLTSGANSFHPTLCGDGLTFLSDRFGKVELLSMDVDGKNVKRLAPDIEAHHPVCAPGGRRTAFYSGGDEHFDVYVVDLNGHGYLNVTNDPLGVDDFVWSPDGNQLAFTSRRDGNSEIYIVGATGIGLRNVTGNPAEDVNPAWLNSRQVAILTFGAAVEESTLLEHKARGLPLTADHVVND